MVNRGTGVLGNVKPILSPQGTEQGRRRRRLHLRGREAIIIMLFYVFEGTEYFLKSRTGIKPGCQKRAELKIGKPPGLPLFLAFAAVL